ncbi:MAG: hypothetical protein ACK2UK_11995 [Candidatus Promineifilaceae bacterium]
MRPISQRVAGRLLIQDRINGLILLDPGPPEDAPDSLYLRFALVTRGPGDHIFPAFILDDWGKEIRTAALYDWVREYGDHFPRGEIFGFEQDGRETQAFLREMEIYARLPCYACISPREPVEESHLLTTILLPDAAVGAPQRIKPPAELATPLRRARVIWWRIPASLDEIDLSRLNAEPDPGY